MFPFVVEAEYGVDWLPEAASGDVDYYCDGVCETGWCSYLGRWCAALVCAAVGAAVSVAYVTVASACRMAVCVLVVVCRIG